MIVFLDRGDLSAVYPGSIYPAYRVFPPVILFDINVVIQCDMLVNASSSSSTLPGSSTSLQLDLHMEGSAHITLLVHNLNINTI